jgi:transcriptional regulator with GAF, ATPase, and Fis domain
MTSTSLVGESEAIEVLRSKIRAAARAASSVLIQGETGTGKELVARSIFESSARHSRRFVPVDCGALPEDLVESELFGHRRGAFTTAVADKAGLFEEANHGTLFLDEIANTSPRFQVKFLRVLQEKRVRRLGDVVDRPLDVRVIAATNCDLRHMARAGDFREDLLYRLNVFPIDVPPLRKRRSDIPLLARHIVDTLNTENGANLRLGGEALEKLGEYSYPGNVRELQNLIESAYYTTDGTEIRAEAVRLPSDHMAAAAAADIIVGDFWESVARPYTNRLITKHQVEEVIRRGLAETRGSYRGLVRLFKLPEADYKRFMDFLRRHRCNVDFRPYRRAAR